MDECGCRLDYQPLFGKGARGPPLKVLLGEGERRHERAAESEPSVDAAKEIHALLDRPA